MIISYSLKEMTT